MSSVRGPVFPRFSRAVVAAGVGLFVAIAAWLRVRHVPALDQATLHFCRLHRAAALTGAMRAVSELGKGPAYVALFALLAVAMRRRRPRALVYLLVCGTGSGVADVLLKLAFARPRPPLALRLVAAGGYSFPSGHSMSAAAFYGALALIATVELGRTRWAVAALCVAVAVAVGVSRVYLCVHYPSDVVAGWALGTSWAIGLRPLLSAARPQTSANPGRDDELIFPG